MDDLTDKDLAFDFGFTIKDIDELDEVQEVLTDSYASRKEATAYAAELAGTADKVVELANSKVAALHKAILPLLNNLQSNPEKSYILWPDRSEKIEEFKQLLQDIVDS